MKSSRRFVDSSTHHVAILEGLIVGRPGVTVVQHCGGLARGGDTVVAHVSANIFIVITKYFYCCYTCLAPPWKYTWCRNVDSAWYSFMPGQQENIAKHKTRDYWRIRQNCRDPYNISSPGFMVLMTCMWARLEILLAYLSTSSSIGVLITRHSAIVLNKIVKYNNEVS